MLTRDLLAAATVAAAALSIQTASAASLQTLYAVHPSNDGFNPEAELISVNGTEYATTGAGGAFGNGAVLSINPATGAATTLYSFTGGPDGSLPVAALVAAGGILYGTTYEGGAYHEGTVFSVNPATGAETVLHSFTHGADGGNPDAALITLNGTLYGTTPYGGASGGGTVFSINPATGAETVLHSFTYGADGGLPDAALINVNGTLYGTTGGGGTPGLGTVFSVNPTTGAETVIYSFTGKPDGSNPSAKLLDVDGTLYGLTSMGGQYGVGTAFALNPVTGAETVLYSFAPANDAEYPGGALIDVGGMLCGTTANGGRFGHGTVYQINPANGAELLLYQFAGNNDGAGPSALTNVGALLYGTTYTGGPSTGGTVFTIDPATAAKSTIHNFSGTQFGGINALLGAKGKLFLTAGIGGAASLGDIVKIDPATGASKELFAFSDYADAAMPWAALIDVRGTFYGTTFYGGPAGNGTVFSFNPATGAETILHDFAMRPDGGNPAAALLNFRGTLYGTTYDGGTYELGTAFKIDPATGDYAVLHMFSPANDGNYPDSGLIKVGGTLYGTTPQGGQGSGTVFEMDRATGAVTVLHSFLDRPDGAYPDGALINVGGMLYGTTFRGGTFENGTVFKFNPANGAETVLYNFAGGADGASPAAALVNFGGTLYGTTNAGGASGKGTVFSINPATAVETLLYSFTGGTDGAGPTTPLIAIGSALYGTTNTGGTGNFGTVFKLTP